jgi:hypothetical protein
MQERNMLDQNVWQEIANLKDDLLSEMVTMLFIQRAIHIPAGTPDFEDLGGPLLILAPADIFARCAARLRKVRL